MHRVWSANHLLLELAKVDLLGRAVSVWRILEDAFWLRGGSVEGRDGRLGIGILLRGHVE